MTDAREIPDPDERPAEEPAKDRDDEMIRIEDLAPRQDVTGGGGRKIVLGEIIPTGNDSKQQPR